MNFKGKWIRNPKYLSDDSDISVLDIDHVEGNSCFTKEKKKRISISELKEKWVRADTIVEDPFKRRDIKFKGEDGLIPTKPKDFDLDALENDINSEAEQHQSQPKQNSIVQPSEYKPKVEQSKEETLISSLKLLGAKSEIDISTKIEIPIDINVIKTLLSTSQDLDKEKFLNALISLNKNEIIDGIIKHLIETI